jgi:hypothetical protein
LGRVGVTGLRSVCNAFVNHSLGHFTPFHATVVSLCGRFVIFQLLAISASLSNVVRPMSFHLPKAIAHCLSTAHRCD